MTTVLAGEPPAESFDRLPPRQLAPSRESWRFTYSQGSHPTEHPSRGVYPPMHPPNNRLLYCGVSWPGISGQQNRPRPHRLEWAKVIERYTRPEMGAIWSERQRIDAWLAVEKAVCEAWNRRGRIPDSAMPAIRAATCDIERMRQIEREVDHDVIAFLRATGESIGADARFVHVGLTSSDVVDTALALQATAATDLVLAGLDNLIAVVGRQASLIAIR